jgi:hypothetical protein
MNRSLVRLGVVRLGLAAGVMLCHGAFGHGALAQSPFPPPPQQSTFPPPPQQSQFPPASQQSVFPAPPQQSTFPPPPQQSVFPSGPGQGPPPPPQAAQCAAFPKLRDDAKAKAEAISALGKHHGDRAQMCAAVQAFTAAEEKVVKFLDDNKTWCGVPIQAVKDAKAMHAKTMQFRDTVCAEGPKPKAPTLSDAIGTPTLDTKKNTSTGRGTFDTLTGNPLAQ